MSNRPKSGKILDMQGRIINPDPPTGFYVAGECPDCGAFIFYHGGGDYVLHSPMGPSQHGTLQEEVIRTCQCESGDVQLVLPDEYNILAERQAIAAIFGAMARLQEINMGLGEQLREAIADLEERTAVLEEGIDLLDSQSE